jgi:hypothetical protein
MLSRFFQESDHLLALYAGESLEELLDRIARFQMIEQTLHRHASTSENRLAAKNFRILRYNAAHAARIPHGSDRRKIDVLPRLIPPVPTINPLYRKPLTMHELSKL